MTYKIVREFQRSGHHLTIRMRLTLGQARTHCRDPETSSSTCTSSEGRRRTRKVGPWFDGYEKE